MIEGGTGGGNTITGLLYEAKVELVDFLNQIKGYCVKGIEVYYNDKVVAYTFKKHGLYRFLKSQGVDWKKHISSKLLPDNCIYVIVNNTLFIVEVKTQHTSGSVDEKLQTCDFKKKQYRKLVSVLNYEVEFLYILDEWFKQPKYKDVLDYIISVGCQYYFNYIPLYKLGLPVPNDADVQ